MAMAELEVHADLEMIGRRDQYPSPAARLALLAGVADGLGLAGTEALRGFDPRALLRRPPADPLEAEYQQALQADLATVDHLVPELDQLAVGNLAPFAQLAGWTASDHDAYGEVFDWGQSLAGAFQKTVPALRSARLIVSAAVGRWAEITRSDQIVDRAAALAGLGRAMVAAIERSRDQTTRAADNRANIAVDDVARDMSQQLRHAEWLAW
jgi:hypothetical protein